jgi:hypothetical protein
MKAVSSPKSDQIFSMLSFLLQASEKLSILIPYKALMVSQEVRLVQIGKEHILIQAPSPHICSIIQDKIYLLTPRSPQGIIAEVQEMSIPRGILTLTGFKFMESSWHERKLERVEPAKPCHILISGGSDAVKGRLENLSQGGFGALIYTKNVKYFPFKPGQNLRTEISLGSDLPVIKNDGLLVFSHQVGQNLTRLGLKFNPKGPQKTLLAQYVTRRRYSILTELERASSMVLDPRCSKDLYF